MKHILLTAIIAILTIGAAQAQKITKRDATSEDMNTTTFQKSPLIYVIGVTSTKIEEIR